MHKPFIFPLCLVTCLGLVTCLAAGSLKADDSVAALGAGGIELLQSEDISMREQDLVLSARKVSTRFVFRNESKADIKTLVAFVMPDIMPEDLAKRDPIPIKDQLGFTVHVDGKAVKYESDVRAIFGEKDITDILKKHNISPEQAGLSPEQLTPEQRALLEKEGFQNEYRTDMAGWDTRVRLYWEQIFPAGKDVEIAHQYTPFLGSENISASTITNVPEFTDSFCMSETEKEDARRLLETRWARAYDLDYVLSTGSNWKGPIGRLTITIQKATPQDVIATCLPGLKSDGDMAESVTLINAKPAEDIRVLFISRDNAL